MEYIYYPVSDNIIEIIELISTFSEIKQITTISKHFSRLIYHLPIVYINSDQNSVDPLKEFKKIIKVSICGNKQYTECLCIQYMQDEIKKINLLGNVCKISNVIILRFSFSYISDFPKLSLAQSTHLRIKMRDFTILDASRVKKLNVAIHRNLNGFDTHKLDILTKSISNFQKVESLKIVISNIAYQDKLCLSNEHITKLKIKHIEHPDSGKALCPLKNCSQHIIKMDLDLIYFDSHDFTSLVSLKLSNIPKNRNNKLITLSMMNLQQLTLYHNCQHIYLENLLMLTYLYVGSKSKCDMGCYNYNLLNIEGKDDFVIRTKSSFTRLTSLVINATNFNPYKWLRLKALAEKIIKCDNLKHVEMNHIQFEKLKDLAEYCLKQKESAVFVGSNF